MTQEGQGAVVGVSAGSQLARFGACAGEIGVVEQPQRGGVLIGERGEVVDGESERGSHERQNPVNQFSEIVVVATHDRFHLG